MPRIELNDLPQHEGLSRDEQKHVRGGRTLSGPLTDSADPDEGGEVFSRSGTSTTDLVIVKTYDKSTP